MKRVYVVRIYGHPHGNIYLGKGGAKVAAPTAYQLMRFADEYGFATESDAINEPVSFLLDGKANQAEVISLEVC